MTFHRGTLSHRSQGSRDGSNLILQTLFGTPGKNVAPGCQAMRVHFQSGMPSKHKHWSQNCQSLNPWLHCHWVGVYSSGYLMWGCIRGGHGREDDMTCGIRKQRKGTTTTSPPTTHPTSRGFCQAHPTNKYLQIR